jgi:PAS domain S-box-containing protein
MAVVALAYFLAHQISFLFPDSARILMAVWPAGGIGLAALLLMPRRLWPAIIATLFAAGNIANILSGRPVVNSLGFMTANVIESLACAWCLTRWCGPVITFSRLREIVVLTCCATLVNACTAFIGAGTAEITRIAPFWSFWETWWVSDGLGILIVTPLIVSWSNIRNLFCGFQWRRTAEFAAFGVTWCGIAWLSVHPGVIHHIFAPQPYMLFALIAWASLRLGMRGATIALAALAAIIITSESVTTGPVPWGGRSLSERLLQAQMFLSVIGAAGFFLAAVYDEARRAEKAARASERKYRELFNNAEVGMFRTTIDGSKIIDFNEKFVAIFNRTREDMQGGPTVIHWADPAERAEMVRRLEASGQVTDFECKMLDKQGNTKSCLTSLRLYRDQGILEGSIIDITDRKRQEEERRNLEQQLTQSQKIESLGVLAGGIAHDFNNLLGGIFGYIDLANEETTDKSVQSHLSKALSTIDRARGLTQQLLTFAKGGAPVKKTGPLFPFVHDTVQFALSGSAISCSFTVPHDLWPCNFDANQLGQVIDNMVINALQAMPMGGRLHLSAANITIDKNEPVSLPEGSYVKISLRDTGVGIPGEIMSRIFDPFFTTKQKGSGLGLSTCFSIISRHGGRITVESEPGKGTTFHIYLPASPGAIADVPQEPAAIVKGTGTILVMDDEEVIRDTTIDVLDLLGYAVVTAKNGQEACDIFSKEPKSFFRAVILDLTVPGGMGGKETAGAIRKMDPSVPIFVSSGYADDPVMSNPGDFGFTGSISKPFRIADLSKMLAAHAREA